MRVDTNVPILKGRVAEGKRGRLARVTPEIRAYADRGARVIVLSHLGRPKGSRVKLLSNQPIAKQMARLVGRRITFVDVVSGKKAEQAVHDMSPGDIVWLENTRFDAREKKDSATLAKEWAAFADIYINNAFGVCHRKHASVHAITRKLPSFAGGLLQEEVRELTRPRKKPFMLVMGGIKLETKLPMLEKLAPDAKAILLGGGIALSVAGAALHRPLNPVGLRIQPEEYALGRAFLKRYGRKVVLPVDLRVGTSVRSRVTRVRFIEDVREGEQVFDIGPKTIRQYAQIFNEAKSIVWNGSMGFLEHREGVFGTKAIARSIARVKGARKILGGGDTVAFVGRSRHVKDFTFISTGGGAMLQFLAGEKLPGLEVLKK